MSAPRFFQLLVNDPFTGERPGHYWQDDECEEPMGPFASRRAASEDFQLCRPSKTTQGGIMTRQSVNENYPIGGLRNGFDYDLQAWVKEGIVMACGHKPDCGCNGRKYAGWSLPNALRDFKAVGAVDVRSELPKPAVVRSWYACPECGCTDVHITAWVDANTGINTQDESPADYAYCPNCDAEGLRDKDLVTVYAPQPYVSDPPQEPRNTRLYTDARGNEIVVRLALTDGEQIAQVACNGVKLFPSQDPMLYAAVLADVLSGQFQIREAP